MAKEEVAVVGEGLDDIAAAIAGGEVQTFVEDPFAVSQEIVSRILAAETPEEVLDQGAALHARDVLDQPFQVVGIRFNKSTYQGDGGGPGVFAVISARFVDQSGELGRVQALTCGSMNVMAQLYRLNQLDALKDKTLAIRETDSPTASGFKPMWLVAA